MRSLRAERSLGKVSVASFTCPDLGAVGYLGDLGRRLLGELAANPRPSHLSEGPTALPSLGAALTPSIRALDCSWSQALPSRGGASPLGGPAWLLVALRGFSGLCFVLWRESLGRVAILAHENWGFQPGGAGVLWRGGGVDSNCLPASLEGRPAGESVRDDPLDVSPARAERESEEGITQTQASLRGAADAHPLLATSGSPRPFPMGPGGPTGVACLDACHRATSDLAGARTTWGGCMCLPNASLQVQGTGPLRWGLFSARAPPRPAPAPAVALGP